MAYTATQSQNCGPGGGATANFGADPIETSGLANLGTLKVAGVTLFAGVGSLTTFTQTYATADVTVPNATYAAPTQTGVATVVTKTNSSPYGFSSGDADKVVAICAAAFTDVAATNVAVAALAADVLILKKLINSLINIDKANGFAA